MAAGKKSHILETVYLVKLLTNYIQFGPNFCRSYPYHFQFLYLSMEPVDNLISHFTRSGDEISEKTGE